MNQFQGINSAGLGSLAGQYDKPIPTGSYHHRLFKNYSTDDLDALVLPGPGLLAKDARLLRGYFYIFIVVSGHTCPHAMRWLQKNLP